MSDLGLHQWPSPFAESHDKYDESPGLLNSHYDESPGSRRGGVGWDGGEGCGRGREVIGIPSLQNREVGSFYHIFVSCLLIDMRFISKLLENFVRQN